ncbi:kinase [Candidatus Woesearchaeota archaeon CG10_big_fil_rev_8_21_14_0_10_45_16]|nr:MAG: kinase [Candidatus Woesearchaeota archaeon CG10_big_fil_rev_8_21_14_0_10_45_16]
MALIIITGTPGTGKSTLAIMLKKKGFYRLDLHEHYKEVSTGYDRSKKAYDVDVKRLEKLVRKVVKEHKDVVFDSHVSHLLPKKMVDCCVVLVCSDLKKLEKRLQERNYSKKKIRENLDAEIFQECLMEAQERGFTPVVVDTATVKKKEMIGFI